MYIVKHFFVPWCLDFEDPRRPYCGLGHLGHRHSWHNSHVMAHLDVRSVLGTDLKAGVMTEQQPSFSFQTESNAESSP